MNTEQPTTKEIPQWMLDAAKVAVDKLMELGGWIHFSKGAPHEQTLYELVILGVAEEFRNRMPTSTPPPPTA